MYKRIAGVETERQLADVEAELRDRYGEPPVPVQQLLRYAALRLQAVMGGVTAIERKRDLVSVKFRQDAPVDPVKLAGFVVIAARLAVPSRWNARSFSPRGWARASC